MAEKAILYDATKCTACRGCQVACKQWNENDEEIPTTENGVNSKNWGSYENPRDLSSSTWIKMKFTEYENGDNLKWLFTRRACMHCTDAACVRACPNGTLYHNDELGIVTYNQDTCTGCGYCVDACPFDVPRLSGNTFLSVNKMSKCTLCTTPGLDRIAEGWEPSCVKTCPPGALQYGDRSTLIATGKNRVQTLKAEGLSKANLYGEKELGGLHVLYVLEESPTIYGLPENPKVPVATTIQKSVLQPIGWVLGGVAIVGLGINYVVARANANKEAK
ncbi:4Fe-4S dicluster domain-containing protein [Chloroflexota bacterium]